MNPYCIQCGTPLAPGTRFCTHCGADNGAAPRKDRRWRWWVLGLLLAFVLGILLGRLLAPACPASPKAPPAACGNGTGGGGGGGAGSGGSPGGGGGGGGGGGAGGTSNGTGGGGGGVPAGGGGTGPPAGGGGEGGGAGSLSGGGAGAPTAGSGTGGGKPDGGEPPAGGGGGGKSSSAEDSVNGGASAADPLGPGSLTKLARGGKLGPGGADPDLDVPDGPGQKTLYAKDLTYDRTQLPHYPDATTQIASALTYPADKTPAAATGSGVGLLTSSPFDTVVAWYRKNLPGGWHDQTIGDFGQFGRTAQQLTPDNLMKMLNGDTKAISTAPASGSQDVLRVSIFQPAAGSADKRGVMIMQKGNAPVQVMMQASFTP